jgi:hypothetical protein
VNAVTVEPRLLVTLADHATSDGLPSVVSLAMAATTTLESMWDDGGVAETQQRDIPAVSPPPCLPHTEELLKARAEPVGNPPAPPVGFPTQYVSARGRSIMVHTRSAPPSHRASSPSTPEAWSVPVFTGFTTAAGRMLFVCPRTSASAPRANP